jgi:hypothetical protein
VPAMALVLVFPLRSLMGLGWVSMVSGPAHPQV